MKKVNIIILAFSLILLLLLINCSKSPTTPEKPLVSSEVGQDSNSTTTTGFFQLLLKDKPVTDALNIYVTINKIRVHKASPENFIVISEEEKEFDLLKLKEHAEIVVEKYELEEGHYNQIRMAVVSGRIIFEDGEYTLEVPSSEIKIPVVFDIEEGTTKVILDFDAEKSIKVTKKGKKDNYILRPVIKVVGVSYQ